MNAIDTQSGWKELEAGPFMARIGPLERGRAEDGSNRYRIVSDPSHCNAIGTVHGGVLTSLLDQAIAIEAWNEAGRQPTVTLQMDTRFINAAKAGEVLEAQATIRHGTRSMLFVDAEVRAGGRLTAIATAVMKIIARKEMK